MELKELTELLQQLAPQWKMLALNLGLPLWKTDEIDNKLRAEDCLLKVLHKWLCSSDDDEEPSLEVLYKALGSQSVANHSLAIKISKDVEVLQLLTVSEREKGSTYWYTCNL